jgi:hypothetical protein
VPLAAQVPPASMAHAERMVGPPPSRYVRGRALAAYAASSCQIHPAVRA